MCEYCAEVLEQTQEEYYNKGFEDGVKSISSQSEDTYEFTVKVNHKPPSFQSLSTTPYVYMLNR